MNMYEVLLEERKYLQEQLARNLIELRAACPHEVKWSPIAGDGQYCVLCGETNFDCDD